MTSRAAAAEPLDGVAGIAFVGFPLHPAKQPGVSRAEHLAKVATPMLFLQGTRDDLADLGLLRPIVVRLGDRATLHVVEHADHMFHVLKRSGRTEDEVMEELVDTIEAWRRAIA
jgi:predicted alpha/beta-hydrolase family hydrolase